MGCALPNITIHLLPPEYRERDTPWLVLLTYIHQLWFRLHQKALDEFACSIELKKFRPWLNRITLASVKYTNCYVELLHN